MSAVDTTPVTPQSATDPDEAATPGCRACAHPEKTHDVIAARFCAATTARGLPRGCACRS